MRRWGLLMATAVFGLMLAPVAHAGTTLTVTRTTDDAVGSAANCTGSAAATMCALRDAVAAANASPGATIELGAQTYDLTHGTLDLTAAMTIAGAGSSASEIDQQTGSGYRVLEINPAAAGAAVTISGVEITGGDALGTVTAPAQGGGVLVDPLVSGVSVTLADDLVTQNYAYGASAVTPGIRGGAAEGGGIAVDHAGAPSLTLANTTVSTNDVSAGDADSSYTTTPGAGGEADGGGVEFASAGTLTVTGGAISANYATGGRGESVNNTSGLVGGDGGAANGAGLEAVGTLALSGTAVENDVARGGTGGGAAGTQAGDGAGGGASGGGILAESAATISGAEVTGDEIHVAPPGSGGVIFGGAQGEGGGIDLGSLQGGDTANVTIAASTIADDSASYETDGAGVGGGLADEAGKFTLENSTIVDNSAEGGSSGIIEGWGGGVSIDSTATLASDTIVDNQTSGYGGNVYVQFTTATATDTIVADGTGTAGADNCDANGSSLGDLSGHANNLESDAGGECHFTGAGDLHAEPQLGSLALNGGSTETLLPARTSPVIAAGGACIDPATSARLAVDERGEPRPTGTAACDIGAVQIQPPADTVAPAITGTAAAGQTLTCATGTWTGDGTLTYIYRWLRGTTQVATGSTYVVAGADDGNSLSCTVSAESAYGESSATSSSVTVPATTTTIPTTTAPTTPPAPSASVSSFRESASKWRRSGKASKHKPPVGTTFTFKLNEAATVTLIFSEPGKGRKVSGKCVAQSAKSRKKPSCALTLGRVTLAGKAGKNSVKFTGKLSGGQLKPGVYTVTVTAKGADGKSSAPISLKFTILD
jgi:hypothetical protein